MDFLCQPSRPVLFNSSAQVHKCLCLQVLIANATLDMRALRARRLAEVAVGTRKRLPGPAPDHLRTMQAAVALSLELPPARPPGLCDSACYATVIGQLAEHEVTSSVATAPNFLTAARGCTVYIPRFISV